MSDLNDDPNNSQEYPVEFHSHKDILGQEQVTEKQHTEKTETISSFQQEVVIETENKLPFSEYQSVKHFCILCIFSFGLYTFFWFFKHWQYLRDEKKGDFNPSFKTAFTLFFGYSLFREFKLLAVEKGYKKRLPLALLFMLFFILALTAALHGTIVLFSFFAFLPLIPIHQMMNFYYLKEQVGYELKKKLSKGEKWFLALIWLFFVFIGIVGQP